MLLLALGALVTDVSEFAALVAVLGFGGVQANQSGLYLVVAKHV